MLKLNLTNLKIIKYFFIGGISTLVHIIVASLYIYFIDDNLFISNILGFLIAYIFSYTVQSKYVFQHAISKSKAIKYFVVQFSALLFSVVASDMFVSFNSYIKTIFVIIIMPLITYTTHKTWTFK